MWAAILLATGSLLATACHAGRAALEPAIEFTTVPPSGEGSPDKIVAIAGRVERAQPGQKLVLGTAGTIRSVDISMRQSIFYE